MAEWRFPFTIRPDRDAAKPYEVRRADEHQCRRLMTTGDVVGVGGDRARVHQTGMGSDDGAEMVDGLVDPGLFEIPVEVRYQLRRVIRVPGARDGGSPYRPHRRIVASNPLAPAKMNSRACAANWRAPAPQPPAISRLQCAAARGQCRPAVRALDPRQSVRPSPGQ